MPVRIPIATKTPGTGADGLSEFVPGEFIDILWGGTGADNATTALSNLGGTPLTSHNAHVGNTSNPHLVTPGQIGAIASSEKGIPNGVASLDGGGKIPAVQIPSIAIPSMHVVVDATARLALTVQEGDEAKQVSDGTHWIYDGSIWHQYPQVAAPVFGTEFQVYENSSVQTTTSTTFQTAALFDTTNLPTGEYRVGIHYGWNHNSPGNDFELEILLNGSQLLEKHKQEPKDSSGSFGSTGTSQKYYTSRAGYVTLTGVNRILLNYRTDNAGTASSIWEICIELWRVS